MPAFSYYLLDYAKCFSLDPDLPEPIRVAATNRLLESLLAVRAPHPVEAILAARITAAHLIMMECLRRSMRHNQGADPAARLREKAALMPRVADSFLLTLEAPKGPVPYRDDILAWDSLDNPDRPLGLPEEMDFSTDHDPMPGEDERESAPGDPPPPAAEAVFSTRHDPMPGEKPAPGPLRNGNPRRDLKTLPCCGARTRAGLACRQPAMRNGRCRMHGGASTGARTEAGRDVLRAKTTTHGFHTAEGQRFLRLISALQATARLLNQARSLPIAELNRVEADLKAYPEASAMPRRIKGEAARATRSRPPARAYRPGVWRTIRPARLVPASAGDAPRDAPGDLARGPPVVREARAK